MKTAKRQFGIVTLTLGVSTPERLADIGKVFSKCCAILLTWVATVSAANADILWYNGDDWGRGGQVANEVTTDNGTFRGYDDFNVTSPSGWLIESVWSNNALRYTAITQASWVIRSGMGVGNAGTIVSSGIGPATLTPTGRGETLGGYIEYTVKVSGLSVSLAPGTYWLSVSPYVGSDPSGSLKSYLSRTSGANAVGSPAGNNKNSLFVWEIFSSRDYRDGFQGDYSLGVAGTVIPEPSAALLLLAGALFLRRSKSRKVL